MEMVFSDFRWIYALISAGEAALEAGFPCEKNWKSQRMRQVWDFFAAGIEMPGSFNQAPLSKSSRFGKHRSGGRQKETDADNSDVATP